MAEAIHADHPLRQEIVVCAMCIGQWLSDQGTPGRWDRLDPIALFDDMGPLSPREASTFLYHLAGLVIHACLADGITPTEARRILDPLPRLTSDPDLRHSLRMILRNLDATLARRQSH